MTKLEQAARQALDALEELFHSNSTKVAVEKYNIAHNALREALMESNISDHKLAEQAEQEPFAWMHPSGGCLSAHYMKEFATGLEKETHTIPLYAAPLAQQDTHATHVVRTKDLTPHEITALIREGAADGGWQGFAQRVIAADRAKNNLCERTK